MDVVNVNVLAATAGEDASAQYAALASLPSVGEAFRAACASSRWKVRANVSVACVLQHKTSGAYRYFHSSANNGAVFDKPATLSSSNDVDDFLETLRSTDLEERAFRQRPNTEWRLFAITNLTFYAYKMVGISRVGDSVDLPRHIKLNRSVMSLVADGKTGEKFKDKLCFFRCLAVKTDCQCPVNRCKCHRVRNSTVKRLYSQYQRATGVTDVTFAGIDEGDLISLESVFDVAIAVYSLNEDGVCDVLWSSGKRAGKRGCLNLNLWEHHFSYIRNITSYTNDYRCIVCDAHFTRASNCKRHKCDPENVTEFVFPGGAFSAPPCIWDEVAAVIGQPVPKELRIMPYRATYDIESLLVKDDLPTDTDTLTFKNKHRLLSVSVCSNVPGFTDPVCFRHRRREIRRWQPC